MMVSKKLVKITKNLILAKKRMEGIETIRPVEIIKPQVIEINPGMGQQFFSKKIPLAPQMPVLDLGRLNQFIQDNEVVAIEAELGKNVKIKKQQLVETNIQLNEAEMSDILNRFAMVSRMQLTPVFKATVGKLTINAFMTPTTKKFLITKKIQ